MKYTTLSLQYNYFGGYLFVALKQCGEVQETALFFGEELNIFKMIRIFQQLYPRWILSTADKIERDSSLLR